MSFACTEYCLPLHFSAIPQIISQVYVGSVRLWGEADVDEKNPNRLIARTKQLHIILVRLNLLMVQLIQGPGQLDTHALLQESMTAAATVALRPPCCLISHFCSTLSRVDSGRIWQHAPE